MIWCGGNQFGLKNNALLELDGDCGPDCSSAPHLCVICCCYGLPDHA